MVGLAERSFNLAILLDLAELSLDLAILEKLRLLAVLSHVVIVVHWLHNYIMRDAQNMLEDDKGYNFYQALEFQMVEVELVKA